MRITHLYLGVRSIEASKDFYGHYFGLSEKFREGEELMMHDHHGFDLALGPQDQNQLPEWFHFGFRLDNKQELIKLYDKIKQDGVKLLEDLNTEEEGFAYFRCADPDGYCVEVYWDG